MILSIVFIVLITILLLVTIGGLPEAAYTKTNKGNAFMSAQTIKI